MCIRDRYYHYYCCYYLRSINTTKYCTATPQLLLQPANNKRNLRLLLLLLLLIIEFYCYHCYCYILTNTTAFTTARNKQWKGKKWLPRAHLPENAPLSGARVRLAVSFEARGNRSPSHHHYPTLLIPERGDVCL